MGNFQGQGSLVTIVTNNQSDDLSISFTPYGQSTKSIKLPIGNNSFTYTTNRQGNNLFQYDIVTFFKPSTGETIGRFIIPLTILKFSNNYTFDIDTTGKVTSYILPDGRQLIDGSSVVVKVSVNSQVPYTFYYIDNTAKLVSRNLSSGIQSIIYNTINNFDYVGFYTQPGLNIYQLSNGSTFSINSGGIVSQQKEQVTKTTSPSTQDISWIWILVIIIVAIAIIMFIEYQRKKRPSIYNY